MRIIKPYITFIKESMDLDPDALDRMTPDDLDALIADKKTIRDAEKVRVLLKFGADPNARIAGFTILQTAVWNNYEDTVRVLLEYGADIKLVDVGETSLLEKAAYKG